MIGHEKDPLMLHFVCGIFRSLVARTKKPQTKLGITKY